jgi:hypothetical protein
MSMANHQCHAVKDGTENLSLLGKPSQVVAITLELKPDQVAIDDYDVHASCSVANPELLQNNRFGIILKLGS